MTFDFTEGQEFAGFKLLQSLNLDDQFDNWLAINTQHNEQVWCKRLPVALGASEQTIIRKTINRHKGLIHPRILRTLELVRWHGVDVLICQHIDSLHAFRLNQSFHNAWPILRQLLEVLDYVHSINLVHGDIRPGNLLIDRQQQLYLAGFGLKINPPGAPENFASPQTLAGQPAAPSDDIYALGVLLFQLLSQQVWQPDAVINTDGDIPDAIKSLLQSLLATSAAARPSQISIIRDTLQAYYDEQVSHQAQQPSASGSAHLQPAQQPESTRRKPSTVNPSAELDIQLHPGPHQKPAVSSFNAMAALSTLVLIAAGIFMLLPTFSGNPAKSPAELTTEATAQTDIQTPAPAQPAVQAARIDPEKSSAETLAEILLRQQVVLEDQGVLIWALTEYSLISNQALIAEELFRQGLYADALTQYQQAIDTSQTLAARIPDLINHNQKIAEDAFTQGNAELAINALSTLIAIRPDNPEYRSDLIRAENLDQVLAWLRQAQTAEREQAWQDALALYQQAQTLDNASQEARAGIIRTTDTLTRLRFNETMSRAFIRLEQGDLTGARQAFAVAQTLFPAATEPQDGLLQVRLLERSQQINALSLKAEQAMAHETWSMAVLQFEQMLALEPGLLAASAGLEQARQRLALDQTLEYYLKAPEHMRLDPALTKARQALIRAAGLANQGPLLQRQINELSLRIAQARIPLPVVVQSDNNTDITVYQTSHLGAFMKRELALVPGTYTVVGRRPGYRDVRQAFTLSGGMTPVTIHLICDEKI
ncbi:MAG: tetratricopeptide repeat protein [SAR86 cluster bacterium]|mgnify:FL=1